MSWQQKLKDATYQRVARKAGVRNLDSQNDVRKIAAYIASNPQLNQTRYTSNAKAAGVKNLDSRNDIKKIDNYLSNRPKASNPKPASGGGSGGSSGAAPAPAPAPAPVAPQADYSSIFKGYQDTIDKLATSYSNAIGNISQSNAKTADKVGDLEQENQSLKESNQRFLDASANDQLFALRSGASTGGDNSSTYGSGDQGLASGTTQYQNSNRESSIREDTPVENSVLSRKGPVVAQLSTKFSRQRGDTVRPNSGLASGSASNYYSSRFS